MPITVGEVNASLKFTLTQSDLVDAQIRLKDLTQSWREVGGSATTAGQAIEAAMRPAVQDVLALKTQAAELKAQLAQFEEARGLRELNRQAADAGQSFNQLEGITIRMIERFAILYAMRETFGFVKNLYDTAETLVALNQRLGLSIVY